MVSREVSSCTRSGGSFVSKCLLVLCMLFVNVSNELDTEALTAAIVTRGPYLQIGTSTGVTIKWRTDIATDSRVRYGTDPFNLSSFADNPQSTSEHLVRVNGLQPETKYYYSIGTSTDVLAGGADYFFVTSPPNGSTKPTRIWVIGDSGTANSNARAVRDAYLTFNQANYTDLWLMLGDNAYSTGTDLEYQAAVFDMYPSLLRQTPLWPTLGNHDGQTSDSATQTGPYYDIFTLPTLAEAGGLASGTEAYYSFDYGDIHFISMDSYETSRSATGPMMTWLKNDVASTTRKWIIAFWHHPPYSKGSHNSDTETPLIEMRQNALPILEQAGVDLVLTGHSHSYERSFLIDGHYGLSSTFSETMKKDGGSGRQDGTGPYRKGTYGLAAHEGAVYAVAGSSGMTSGGQLNHPAMYLSLNSLGSLVLDLSGNTLEAKFIDNTGAIRDYFTLVKGATSSAPLAPSNLFVTSTSSDQLALSWTDESDNEEGFKIEQSTDGSTYTEIATAPANATSFNVTSLSASTLYYYRIRAFNGSGDSPYSNPASVETSDLPASPAAPSGLTAFAVSSAQIRLSWIDNSNNEQEFKIEQSADNVSFSQIAVTPADSTSYSATGLSPSTTYYFRIRAANETGDSDYSNAAVATTSDAVTAPAAPTALTSIPVSSSQIDLAWQDHASNEDGFQIETGTDGVNFALLASLPPDTTSYAHLGLIAATTHYYRVRAYNSGGNSSDFSNSTQATTLNSVSAPPVSPESLIAKVSRSPARLIWYYKPPVDNNTDTLVRNYHFYILTKTDEPTRDELKAKGAPGPFLQYLLSNEIQDPGDCTIQPFRNQVADQIGDFCEISAQHPDWFLLDQNGNRIRYPDGTKTNYQMDPGNPGWRAFWLDRARAGQEQLGWDGIFLDNVDASIRRFTRQGQTPAKYPDDTSYRAAMEEFVRDLYDTYFKQQNRPLYGNITEVNDPAAWFQYIRHLDGAMNETFALDWDPGFKTVQAWEENLERAEGTEQLGKASILISQGDQTNLPRQIFAYASYLLVVGSKNTFRYSKPKMNRYAWLYANYEFDLGEPLGPRYQQNGVWWRDFTKGKVWVDPAAHTSEILPAAGNQLDLSWQDKSDNEEGFSIHRSKDGVNFGQVADLPAGTTQYCDTGLEPSMEYYYRMYAYSDGQMSEVSNTTTGRTNPSSPVAPGNLNATAVSVSQVDLTWSDNSQNETEFKIERSTDGANFVFIATVAQDTTKFADKTVLQGTTYHYKVRSYNSGGTAYSNSSSATTPSGPPVAPSGLTATAVSTNKITLTWVDESTNESGHKLERSTDNQKFNQIATLGANVTSYTNGNLASATTYYYRVRAYNNLGDSPYSSTASAATFGPPPAAPTNLAVTVSSATEITIAWSDNSANEDGFHVEHSSDGSVFLQLHAAVADVTQYTHQGLEAKSQHYYRVRAYNSDGQSAYSNTVSATTSGVPPAPPAALVATALSSAEIELLWTDAANDEDGFKIERSTDNASFSQISQTAPNATSFKDSSLSSSTTYYYRVRAFNSEGNSAYSNVADTTTMQGPPAAPTGLKAVAMTATEVQLGWLDNSNNEDYFEIERSRDGTSFTRIADGLQNATSHSDTQLDPGTEYYYRIRAVNGAGSSAYTEIVMVTTPVLPPDAPTSLEATAVSSAQVSLSWVDNSSNEDGFKIERSIDGTAFGEIAQTAAGNTAYDDNSVLSGKTYHYRVRAFNTGGDSPYTEVAGASTPLTPPPAPTGLQMDSSTSTEVQLSWTDNSTNEDGFLIEQSSDGTSFVKIETVAANATVVTVSGLTPESTYYYRVRAFNTAGESDNSNTISAITRQVAPQAPGNLTAQTVSSSSIDLTWSDGSNNEDGFRLERSTDGTSFVEIAAIAANSISYSNTGLQAGTLYYYRVRAFNTAGFSGYSNTSAATTQQTVPAAPTSLIASAASTSQINLSWTDNSSNENGFAIERSPDGSAFIQIATVGSGVITYSNTGLESGTKYYYRVRAYNTAGNSPYSNTASATTQTLISIPIAPGDLVAGAVSRSEISLAWTDNSTNEQGFKIERSTDGKRFSQIATVGANINMYRSTNLKSNRLYYFRVRAYNTAGNSNYSNVASAKTPR